MECYLDIDGDNKNNGQAHLENSSHQQIQLLQLMADALYQVFKTNHDQELNLA
ncbi:21962_t:CDS:1, partial [Gigaspora rosea]